MAGRTYSVSKPSASNSKMHRLARGVQNPIATWSQDAAVARRVGRWLYCNTAAGRQTVWNMAGRVVGQRGILPQFGDRDLDWAFRRWAKTCRRGKQRSWRFAQVMLLSEWLTAGEGFHRRDVRNKKIELVPFEAEQLSWTPGSSIPGGRFSHGVEYDEMNVPVAFHVARYDVASGAQIGVDVVPADRVVHVYREERVGQLRGVSQYAAGAPGLFDQDDAVLAELKAILMRSYAGLHFKPNQGEGGILEEMGAQTREDDNSGPSGSAQGPAQELVMEPGQAFEYNGEVKLLDANRPGGSFIEFVRRMERLWAVSMGIPPWVITGDYSEANYSSMRAGENTCKQTYEEVQTLLIETQCEYDVRDWLVRGLASGELKLPRRWKTVDDAMADIEWQRPAWPYVDPLKDIQADSLEMALGISTWDQVLSKRGKDGLDQRWLIQEKRRIDAEMGVETPDVVPGFVLNSVVSVTEPSASDGQNLDATGNSNAQT